MNRYTRQEWLAGRRFRLTRPRGGDVPPPLVPADESRSHACQQGRHGECRAHEIGYCVCSCHATTEEPYR